MKLVVKEPFDSYRKGNEITDLVAVTQTLKDHPEKVVKVLTSEPAPAAEPARA